jgi:hypothetical protein
LGYGFYVLLGGQETLEKQFGIWEHFGQLDETPSRYSFTAHLRSTGELWEILSINNHYDF